MILYQKYFEQIVPSTVTLQPPEFVFALAKAGLLNVTTPTIIEMFIINAKQTNSAKSACFFPHPVPSGRRRKNSARSNKLSIHSVNELLVMVLPIWVVCVCVCVSVCVFFNYATASTHRVGLLCLCTRETRWEAAAGFWCGCVLGREMLGQCGTDTLFCHPPAVRFCANFPRA